MPTTTDDPAEAEINPATLRRTIAEAEAVLASPPLDGPGHLAVRAMPLIDTAARARADQLARLIDPEIATY